MVGGRLLALVVALVCGVTTVIVALNPHFRFAFGQPGLQSAVETAASLVALLAAFLMFGRLRRRGRLMDLALASALGIVALSNVFFAAVPITEVLAASNFVAWSVIISRSLRCMLFGVAAFVPARRIRRIGRAQVAVLACTVSGLTLALLTGTFEAHLHPALTAGPPVRSATLPAIHADPVLLMLEILTAVIVALGAIGYLIRSRRLADEFFGWLAIAAVFGAAAHINYFLYPSLYLHMVSVGDAFRLCFCAALLIGSMREIWSYWRALPDAMVVSERQRIARDLHDGLAQELAYLTRNLESLNGSVEQETLSRLRGATERARLESRLAVSRLVAIDRPAVEDESAETAGEGVTNAARHSGAGQMRLSLRRQGSRVRLRVSDSGSGFDPAGSAAGFGLISMCEGAGSVGGEVKISSTPGLGTEVEALL